MEKRILDLEEQVKIYEDSIVILNQYLESKSKRKEKIKLDFSHLSIEEPQKINTDELIRIFEDEREWNCPNWKNLRKSNYRVKQLDDNLFSIKIDITISKFYKSLESLYKPKKEEELTKVDDMVFTYGYKFKIDDSKRAKVFIDLNNYQNIKKPDINICVTDKYITYKLHDDNF